MKSKEERELERRCMAVSSEVESILRRDYGAKWFRLRSEDQLRLLRLKQWEEKYHVSVEWILSKLIPFWKSKYARYRNSVGFGVTVATLVGKVSEEVLQNKIKEEFPDGENIKRWKSIQQQFQLGVVCGDNDRVRTYPLDVFEAVERYKRRIGQERAERGQWTEKLARRNYRGNPWL